jgi:geranylgeranyl pyrophosphate synthase
MLDYPAREEKGFRPAFYLAMFRLAAAALAMFHNAFLIHDDIGDESESRRGERTLAHRFGIGIATNVGGAQHARAADAARQHTASRPLGCSDSDPGHQPVGAFIADVPPARLGVLVPFGFRISAAFQI